MLGRLYAITDRRLIRRSLSEDIEAAVRGGAEMIQLREKDITEEKYICLAREALSVCAAHNVPLIINDSVSVCLAAGAAGVHLGESDADPRAAREALGAEAIIGVTAKTPERILLAQKAGADYIGAGAVFGTATKSDAKPLSIAALKELVSLSDIPVFAIGGINADNAAALFGTGIYGIAAVSGIFKGDIENNARRLREAVKML